MTHPKMNPCRFSAWGICPTQSVLIGKHSSHMRQCSNRIPSTQLSPALQLFVACLCHYQGAQFETQATVNHIQSHWLPVAQLARQSQSVYFLNISVSTHSGIPVALSLVSHTFDVPSLLNGTASGYHVAQSSITKYTGDERRKGEGAYDAPKACEQHLAAL